MTALSVGTFAPSFTLLSTPDQTLSLSDFKRQLVILIFYPADWSPVCQDQLSLYNELLPEFDKYQTKLMAISVDGPWCHWAFAAHRKFHFCLLSDFEPKGKVSRAYGIYQEQLGQAERAIFIINKKGLIQWSYVSPMGVNPVADGILNALDQLQPPSSR